MLPEENHSTKLVTLYVFWFTASETALVNEVGKILRHHLFDHLSSFVQTFLGLAGDAEVERRVLLVVSRDRGGGGNSTNSSGRHVLVRVVFSSGGDILHMYKQVFYNG